MEMKKLMVSYLNPVLMDNRGVEQSQEVRIPDGMPDIDKIVGVWGQPVLRGKEWRGDTVGFTGGVMLWILYRAEGDDSPQTLDAWVPIQSRWGIPEDSPEGKLTLGMGLRFLDARMISPRKIMVRTGLSLYMQALSPQERAIITPDDLPKDVFIQKESHPLRLHMEAGEKAFAIEDTLSAAGEDLSDWKICAASVRPMINDQKVVGNKIAFRGGAELSVLFVAKEGGLEQRSFMFPFAQFAELDGSFGSTAEVDVLPCVTNLELEENGEGTKELKLGLTAQYTVTDLTTVETIADAYSNVRMVRPVVEQLDIAPILEERWETLGFRAALPGGVNNSIQLNIWNEEPKLQQDGEGQVLLAQGMAQLLYRGENGPEGKTIHWDADKRLRAGKGEKLFVTALQPGQPKLEPGKDGMELTGEIRCQIVSFGTEGIPMVTDLELGEEREPDPSRPSLILCRAGRKPLWELAKENGSTVDAIRQANALEGEPEENQMILIPIA